MSVAVALGLLVVLSPYPSVAAPPVSSGPAVVAAADSTPLLFARARALARAGQGSAAVALYVAGARAAETAADFALYRRDLALIGTKTELTVWDKAAPSERPALIEAFWSGRDARDGLAPGGRFIEHVRRVDVALADYRVHPRRGKTPITKASVADSRQSALRDYIPTQGELDDRGVIYVRYGAPDARALLTSPSVESWVYQRDGQNLVVHFGESVYGGSSGNGVLIAAPPPAVFASLCEVDQQSCRIAARGSLASPEMREQFRQRSLASIKTLTTTDDAAPKLE